MGDVLWQAGQPLQNSRMTHTINDHETLALAAMVGVTRAGVVLDSRRRMGVIVDSVFDGQFVWALSRETLWRVT